MNAEIAGLLALWSLCEVVGQVLFKLGVDGLGSDDVHFGVDSLARAVRSPAIWGGIALHVVEFFLWLEILGRLPLSIAFPLESISYVIVLLATRIFLREAISIRRWAGVGLICAGIAVLGGAAA